MGFRISWVAVKGMPKAKLLEHFGFRDTHESDEANESDFSVAELPTGWSVLWSNDPTFAKVDICTPRSLKAPVISCLVNETAMFSSVNYFERGDYLWFAGHDAQEGIDSLEWEGNMPPQFDEIRTRLQAEQNSNGGKSANVDFIFDIPLELAQSICGFKHDLCEFEWGSPKFTVVDASNPAPPSSVEQSGKKGWLGRIFGGH